MENKIKKLRACVYTRVSSEEQAKGYSLSFQEEEIKEMIEKDGAVLKGEHVFVDDGHSGVHGNRPALKAMIDFAKREQFDIIYVWKIDRLYRNTKLVLNLVDDLAKVGVGVKSILEPFCDSSTPIGRYMFTMLSAGAEMEHANINERTYHGKVRAMREGKWLCGTAPYGYDQDKKTGKLKINKVEAKWARQFFEWLVNERLTLFKLHQRVNSLGITTKSVNLGRKIKITSKTFWNKRTLGRLLTNEIYKGKFYYRKYKYPSRAHKDTELRPREEWISLNNPPIVSEEIFDLAQKQIQKNSENSPRKTKRLYMFAKKLVCGVCNHKLNATFRTPKAGTMQIGTKLYRGAWVNKHTTDRMCSNCSSYSEPRLDKVVWENLIEFLSNPNIAMRNIEGNLNKKNKISDIREEIEMLSLQEQKEEKKKSRVVDSYFEGDISKPVYKQKLSACEKGIKHIQERKNRLSQYLLNDREKMKRIVSAKALYIKMKRLLKDTSYEVRCKIINIFVESITLTGNHAEVELFLPFKDSLPEFLPQVKRVVAGKQEEVLWGRRGVDCPSKIYPVFMTINLPVRGRERVK